LSRRFYPPTGLPPFVSPTGKEHAQFVLLTAQGLIRELKPSGCYGESASTLEVRIDDG
jgi:hypothetical protein